VVRRLGPCKAAVMLRSSVNASKVLGRTLCCDMEEKRARDASC
jgi:hypothetical protein